MIDFKNKKLVLSELNDAFPVRNNIEISLDLLAQYEGDIVYDYFYGKKWVDLVNHLDFRSDGEILEKGCLYLNCNEFRYYFPLYIYASLINDGCWAFEYSFFLHYLTPGVIEEHCFYNFIDEFSVLQRSIIYDFVFYKAIKMHDPMAKDAFNLYWVLYS